MLLRIWIVWEIFPGNNGYGFKLGKNTDTNQGVRREVTYAYDLRGNMTKQTQPNGDEIRYHYNEKNLLDLKQTYLWEKTRRDITGYDYDPDGGHSV